MTIKLTQTDFEQYRARIAEIDLLCSRRVVADSVRGSDVEHPYSEHSIRIRGTMQQAIARDGYRAEKLREKCEAVRAAIEAVEDSKDRVVLTMRYIEGWSWDAIGLALLVSEDAARKRVARFFQKYF